MSHSAPSEIDELAAEIFCALRAMDEESEDGLRNYVSCSPYAGKRRKDEAAITWGITRALATKWHVEQGERKYPRGGGRCDRVIHLREDNELWLEVKLAWRSWFNQTVMHNAPFMYQGYFSGGHHSHSVAGDFAKLERLTASDGRYAALLVVGFDHRDGVMASDMAALVQKEQLAPRGWHVHPEDSWPNRHSSECWHRCWFAWRDLHASGRRRSGGE